jgi:HSP20 family protein
MGEIRYGKFSRTFFLPEQVNSDKIEAKYDDGMLLITIPKTEKVLPKTIAIK